VVFIEMREDRGSVQNLSHVWMPPSMQESFEWFWRELWAEVGDGVKG
jgi:hypothetical protein